jgi:hypothetical protein
MKEVIKSGVTAFFPFSNAFFQFSLHLLHCKRRRSHIPRFLMPLQRSAGFLVASKSNSYLGGYSPTVKLLSTLEETLEQESIPYGKYTIPCHYPTQEQSCDLDPPLAHIFRLPLLMKATVVHAHADIAQARRLKLVETQPVEIVQDRKVWAPVSRLPRANFVWSSRSTHWIQSTSFDFFVV